MKKTAFILAIILMLNTVFTAHAANIPQGGNPGAEGDTGQVEVSVSAAMTLQRSVEFTVRLTDAQGVGRSGSITLDPDAGESRRLSFEHLADGKYILEVSAKGFATYRQELEVDGAACRVSLTTGFVGKGYGEEERHPGILLIGDVNGDGKVDAADGTGLIDAIDSGRRDAGITADLNGDGRVDLLDLEYYARGYHVTADTTASVERFVPAAAVQVSAPTGTKAEGDLNGLLRSQAPVRLTPVNNGQISETNPVTLEFDFAQVGAATADGILIETDADNPISSAQFKVTYWDEAGQEWTAEIPVTDGVEYLLNQERVRAERDSNGNIVLHLGGQVALKRVTLTITGMKNSNNLAEISRVEFVNGMENRIPEPEMDIPQNLTAAAGNQQIRLTWDACVNITGYEVQIEQGGRKETVAVRTNSADLTSFGGRGLENYQEYRIRVQSVNGTWSSGYGSEVTAVPMPSGRPDKPDGVSAKGYYRSITVSWKKMKDTVSYNVYYKESGETEYRKLEGIRENSCSIDGLKDLTEYTAYVTGVNEFGESAPSLSAAATTTDRNPPVVPRYHLINVGEPGEKGAHIISASMSAQMLDSPLDVEAGTAWGTVDRNPASCYYMGSWDDGGYNDMSLRHGLTYEFDQAYKMDTIAFHDLEGRDSGYRFAKVRYWDEAGNQVDLSGVSLERRQDAAGRIYGVIKLPTPVSAKKLQFGLARYSAAGTITVSEVYFYYYDTLMDEIMALYVDDLHTVLRQGVTQADIDALRVKINTRDEVSGEYHPDRELLEKELQTAEAILNDKKLNAPVIVHSGITTKDVGRGFGGLNAWQPLGVTAAAQEEIMVYVGHAAKKTGEAAELQLVATQYHAESGSVGRVIANLKVGANKITVPKNGSTTGVESGGALYVQYTGDAGEDRYAVRVSGGAEVPILDLYRVEDAAERLARVKAYVEKLQDHVARMQETHAAAHAGSGNGQVAYAYDSMNCILGASDILLDTMMFSLPAAQILNGAGNGSTEEKAGRILDSMNAMEGMMHLFYQHKGLNNSAADAVNRIPLGHLNIRYQRMFSGAFMYAAGNHIGIEWSSAAGMVSSVPVTSDGAGKYVSGRYFGWGIAHEIGHCINQNTYAIAEITNNYFSVLAQARDTNDSVRFQYDKVYEKVTSGTRGRASSVFTQLGMYWQLHLAYDSGYNFKTYDNYSEQLENLFFARVDTYARNTEKAPAPKGTKLTLAGDKDQDLMRLSCAAAKKNILEFFRRWGMTPNEETCRYAEQFDVETRAIYYVNDDSRVYRLKGGKSALGTDGDKAAVGQVTAVRNASRANQIDFTLSSTLSQEDVLGYEIVRCMISGGATQRETVGFATGNTFSDTVSVNNRVVWYEITVIDKYLNRSAVKTLDPIKVEHDGSLEKTFWTVETKGLTAADVSQGTATDDLPCVPEADHPADKVIDNQNTVFTATIGKDAEITLDFHKTLTVTALKYTGLEAAESGYEIMVCVDGTWVQAADGKFGQEKSGVIYFTSEDKGYVSTHAATAVKLMLKGQDGSRISIEELDVLGVTGDNVDFRRTDDSRAVIGRLSADYRYAEEEKHVIPEGSIVFTGSYKGNPAYNVVILYDQDGQIVGGTTEAGELKAHQIILADIPAEGEIQNVYDGIWIYWIEPEQTIDLQKIKSVRVELYRVNNAQTNAGQRLVSDSLWEAMPGELPYIQISGN